MKQWQEDINNRANFLIVIVQKSINNFLENEEHNENQNPVKISKHAVFIKINACFINFCPNRL